MRRTALVLLLAALAIVPAPARASQSQESLFEDEASLLYSGPERRDQTLDELRDLGVDVIRANVVWNRYAPSPRSKSKPSFDASDPNVYPLGEVDALVAGAAARGMVVLLTPTVPGPAWASSCGGSASSRRICSPKPAEFGQFVTALGRRYPTVTRWSILNEPNQGGWLTPQWKKSGRTHIPASPTIYRNLLRAATGALAASGHGGDQVLLGETAPIGRTSGSYARRSLAPADFYRELFCLDRRGHKLRGKAARMRGCTSFTRLAVTGIAHHPYTRGAGQSLGARVGRADITLAHISRLTSWIGRAAHQRRISGRLPIWITEFGFQTNPPDRFAGTSLTRQAKWLNQSDWIAWRNSRIRSVAQYEMRDERSTGAFQTGLRFLNGKAKPALAAYRLPIWVIPSGHSTKVWLQVRPRGGDPVTVQYVPRGAHTWRNAGTFTVNSRGYLYRTFARRAAYWRFVWNGQVSRKAAP
jgi:Cellulase (glycosyl hydrolase family 5)